MSRSVRFDVSDDMYLLIAQEADELGVSVAEFCRETALVRMAVRAAARDAEWTRHDTWRDVIAAVNRARKRRVRPLLSTLIY